MKPARFTAVSLCVSLHGEIRFLPRAGRAVPSQFHRSGPVCQIAVRPQVGLRPPCFSLAEQEGAPRHDGQDQDMGRRLGCGPSEADLCDRKGRAAFASGTGTTDFTQFSSPLKAKLSAPCQDIVLWHIVLPFLSGSLLRGLARRKRPARKALSRRISRLPLAATFGMVAAGAGRIQTNSLLRLTLDRNGDQS